MVAAFLIVVLFAGGFPFLAVVCHEWRPARPWFEYVLIPSPGYAAVMAFDAPARTSPFNHFYPSVIFTHVLSWLLLLAASFIVPRTWQDKALTAEEVRRRERVNRIRLGSSEARRGFRRSLLEVNPFYWLVARHRTKPLAVWALLALAGFIWTLGLVFDPRDWKHEAAYIWTAVLLHTALKCWVATEASRRFSLDRQSGALELLLSTPLPVKDIMRGQWLGLERQFVGPVFVVLLADFVFCLAGPDTTEMVIFWVVLMIVFVADLITLAWVGMWRGLNSRRPNRAAAAALVRVLVLPWMLFLLTLTLVGVWNLFRGWDAQAGLWFALMVALAVDAFFGLPARRRLLTEFREVATQRFEVRGGKSG
jgi:hypothetical protein